MFDLIGAVLDIFKEESKEEKPKESKEEPKEETCSHDWEIVSYGEYAKCECYDNITYVKMPPEHVDQLNFHRGFYSSYTYTSSANRVCLLCGECDNQEDRWKERYKSKIRERKLKTRRNLIVTGKPL